MEVQSAISVYPYSLGLLIALFIVSMSHEVRTQPHHNPYETQVGKHLESNGQPAMPVNMPADKISPLQIAISLAVTSRSSKWSTDTQILHTFPFFKSLLISFCQTNSNYFLYQFYLAFDQSDKFYRNTKNLQRFQNMFYDIIETNCTKESKYELYFVHCHHNKHPAYAQNDAMMIAYMNHADYYYRINDDTTMVSSRWTETFIWQLQKFQPPNIGVVGPNQLIGPREILTYDFVHRTHIDIFGFYYSRDFLDWFADHWMSRIYPRSHTKKFHDIKVRHTMEKGQRYHQHHNVETRRNAEKEGAATINRYGLCIHF